MPDTNRSHITLILDRSGSMSTIRDDVMGAVNQFIDDQKKVGGACTFTLVQFDDQVREGIEAMGGDVLAQTLASIPTLSALNDPSTPAPPDAQKGS